MSAIQSVRKSSLFINFEDFTVSDMCGRCQLPRDVVSIALKEMVDSGEIIRFIRNNRPCYTRGFKPKPELNKRLANWTPPRPLEQEHLNPWVNMGEYQ